MSESEENHLTPLELELLNSIINQFKSQDSDDYYKSQGINYIKRNISLNDPLLDPVFETMAQNIKTPLEEWNDRFGETKTLFVYESDINY
jgi:hypothetical protein